MPTENAHQRYLAELPNSWSICDLRALGSIVGGSTPSRAISRFWNGNIPWVTPGEMTALVGTKFLNDTRERITRAGYESCGTRLLPPSSLLITTRATLGLVALAGCEVSTNQGFKSVVFCRDNYPDFYFHLFHRLKPEMERLASGTTFLEISAGDFGRITIPVPPPSEQRAIAAVLDTIDDAIQKTEQIIAKLQQVKQGLLHDLLTRGIDDNGELRDPERHPEQFQDSPLGRIPKGWRLVRLRDVATKIADRDHTTPRYVDDGILMVSPTNLSGEEDIDFIACRRIPLVDHRENRKKTDIEVGDLIIHRIGAGLGAIREVNDSMPEFSILHSMAMIRISRSRTTAAFVRWALRSSAVQGQMGLGTQSIGVPDLGLDKIGSLEFYLPENSEQLAIASVLDTLVRRIEEEAVAREKLQQMRRGISDDLLTGRVRTTSLPGFSA